MKNSYPILPQCGCKMEQIITFVFICGKVKKIELFVWFRESKATGPPPYMAVQ